MLATVYRETYIACYSGGCGKGACWTLWFSTNKISAGPSDRGANYLPPFFVINKFPFLEFSSFFGCIKLIRDLHFFRVDSAVNFIFEQVLRVRKWLTKNAVRPRNEKQTPFNTNLIVLHSTFGNLETSLPLVTTSKFFHFDEMEYPDLGEHCSMEICKRLGKLIPDT